MRQARKTDSLNIEYQNRKIVAAIEQIARAAAATFWFALNPSAAGEVGLESVEFAACPGYCVPRIPPCAFTDAASGIAASA